MSTKTKHSGEKKMALKSSLPKKEKVTNWLSVNMGSKGLRGGLMLNTQLSFFKWGMPV